MSAPLDLAEVKRRLGLYADSKVTDELYSFGQALIADAVDRLNKLDGKASALTTYAGGLLTVMVSTSPFWGKYVTLPALVLLVLAAFGLILSGVFGAQVMNLKIALWYSDNDWMRTDVITDADQLRRYHVLTMWTVLGSHRDAAANKLKRLKQGITVLYAALAILAVAILLVTSNVLIQPQGADSHITVGDD